MLKKILCLTMASLVFSNGLWADESETKNPEPSQAKGSNPIPRKKYPEQSWGLGAGVRFARIPFSTEDETVLGFIPRLYFENDLIFIRGQESGIKIFRSKPWKFNALIRRRFFDIPAQYQNQIQEDTVDMGFQLRYVPRSNTFIEFELLSDPGFRFHSNLRAGLDLSYGALDWKPFVNLSYRTSDFNDYYYGLDGRETIGSGTEISAGIDGELHLISNLYLIGSFKLTSLGHNVRNSAFIDKDYLDETFLGIKLSNERKKTRKPALRNTPYLRLAHGWATPSSLAKIIRWQTETDPYNNQLTSLFYGHPLTDTLFGLPLDIYLTPGFVWHWDSEVQSSAQEYVVAIKAYYEFKWPIAWRLGAAEGMSHISQVTYVEESKLTEKGYETSQLMNYLDFSLDINIGKLFRAKNLYGLWLGYSIHHRSSIFESASHFGRISGGSNYNTVYLQWHF